MTHILSDEELARLVAQGDADAYTSLYERYITPIYRFVYFRVPTKDHAEDIVSDIFFKLWHKRSSFDAAKGTSYKAWLYTIARRSIIDWRRSHRSTEDLTHAVHIGTVDDHADPHQSLLFNNALQQLSQDQQDILRLRFWHDLSFQEIATIMHKRPESCRMQASRALKSLRGMLPAELFLSCLFSFYA